MTTEALIFDVDEARFGVWSTDVKQVLQAVAISKLPGAPHLIEGIINIHSHVVPVLNFRGLFQLPAKEVALTDHLIVLQMATRDVAIRVDRAVDLIELDAETLEETQITVAGGEFTGTIGKTSLGLIHVLDIDRLLSPAQSSLLTECLVPQPAEDGG